MLPLHAIQSICKREAKHGLLTAAHTTNTGATNARAPQMKYNASRQMATFRTGRLRIVALSLSLSLSLSPHTHTHTPPPPPPLNPSTHTASDPVHACQPSACVRACVRACALFLFLSFIFLSFFLPSFFLLFIFTSPPPLLSFASFSFCPLPAAGLALLFPVTRRRRFIAVVEPGAPPRSRLPTTAGGPRTTFLLLRPEPRRPTHSPRQRRHSLTHTLSARGGNCVSRWCRHTTATPPPPPPPAPATLSKHTQGTRNLSHPRSAFASGTPGASPGQDYYFDGPTPIPPPPPPPPQPPTHGSPARAPGPAINPEPLFRRRSRRPR
jgi:hypothetical protein